MHDQSNLSEQDLLNDLLNQEKQMISSYSTFITEASCENLRCILTNQFNQTCTDQYEIFDNMRQKGYYEAKDAPKKEVVQTKQKFEQLRQSL
jgi:spore coat protein F